MNNDLLENSHENQIEGNEEICSICLNQLCNEISTLNCNHTYCTECINNLINNKDYNCPLCRTTISRIIDSDNNTTNIRNISLILPRRSNLRSFITNYIPLIVFTSINLLIFAGTFNYNDNNNCEYINNCLKECIITTNYNISDCYDYSISPVYSERTIDQV
tara:strand:+ start:484 stop:969 length:486 start_codon:yes stop_codon:yes gene_type:complete